MAHASYNRHLKVFAELFKNRGQIADATKLSGACNQLTDIKKEEIIGKIAGFLTTRSCYYSIIGVGQAVREVPVAVTVGAVDYTSTSKCVVYAEQAVMAIYYRDAFNNHFALKQFQYLE